MARKVSDICLKIVDDLLQSVGNSTLIHNSKDIELGSQFDALRRVKRLVAYRYSNYEFCAMYDLKIGEALDGIYIVFNSKLNDSLLLPKDIEDVNVEQFLEMAFIFDFDVKPIEGLSPEGVLNIIDVPNRKEWNSLQCFYPQIRVLKLKAYTPSQKDLFVLKRLFINLCCIQSESYILPFLKDSLDAYQNLINKDNLDIPIDNIIDSIKSNSWTICFLSLYQCVERLYVLAWVNHFCNIFTPHKKTSDLFKLMLKEGIEHHENQHIEHLFLSIPEAISKKIEKFYEKGQKAADYIYNLRNSIVHYQITPSNNKIQTEEDWNIVIQFMLETIVVLYDNYSKYLGEIPNADFKNVN